MAQRRPLFAGDSEIDQIFKIFRVLGTPKEETWPNIHSLPNFKKSFPKWAPQPLNQISTNLDSNGIDLLKAMIQLDPSKRISARDALNHVIIITIVIEFH